MPDIDTTAVSGVEARGYRRGAAATDGWDQYVIPTTDRIVTFQGRACAFKTPGRGAVSQKIMAIHNASGSPVLVSVNRIRVDLLSTAVKAQTVVPPVIRVDRFTALPTGGSALTKGALDTSLSSNAAVTVWGDASADGTGSGTTLTLVAGQTLAQTYAPRILTAVGYEPFDTAEFFLGDPNVTLRPLEGIVVFLESAVVTAGIPTTDHYVASIDWDEYTRP